MGSDAYQTLAERLNYPDSKYLHRILEVLMTPQQAELVALVPAPVEEMATKLGVTVDVVEQEIDDLCQRGVIYPTPKGYYFARRGLIQLHQSTLCDPRYDAYYGSKLSDAWEDFFQNEWCREIARERLATTPRALRIVPMYQAIKDIAGVQPWEDMREILRESTAIAAIPCVCRRQTGNRCGRALDVCLHLDKPAEYIIERGLGRKLSLEEAISVVDTSEEDGLLHRLFNQRSNYGLICNCCVDDCVELLSFDKVGKLHEGDAKSRFEAVVDQELCNGCQICVERCQYDAIEMVKLPAYKKLKAAIDLDKCMGCGACVIKCEQEALSLKLVRPEEHVPVVLTP